MVELVCNIYLIRYSSCGIHPSQWSVHWEFPSVGSCESEFSVATTLPPFFLHIPCGLRDRMNENLGPRRKLCAHKQEKTTRGNAFTLMIRECWSRHCWNVAVMCNTVTLYRFFFLWQEKTAFTLIKIWKNCKKKERKRKSKKISPLGLF